MRSYTAHLKRNRPVVLQREGWSWGAFLFGAVWLLAQRAWIPALLELALLAVVVALAPSPLHVPVAIGAALLNGLLGHDFVRWSLERRGYTLEHVLLAPNHDAALFRLFTARPDLVERAA